MSRPAPFLFMTKSRPDDSVDPAQSALKNTWTGINVRTGLCAGYGILIPVMKGAEYVGLDVHEYMPGEVKPINK